MSNIENDILGLKKKVAKLKLEVERAEAVTACANLMNKYQTYHCKGMATEETLLFAIRTPGACVEMLWGIYDEPEGVIRWKRSEGFGKPRKPIMWPGIGHGMTTPIIEVAKDGQTAKGLWIMFGSEGDQWASAQFAMDFIKENGEWKIWKYITTAGYKAPFEKGWHKIKQTRAEIEEGIKHAFADTWPTDAPAEMIASVDKGARVPDRRPSFPWLWSPDDLMQNIPPVPLPYETWDDSLACVPVPGAQWKIEEG